MWELFVWHLVELIVFPHLLFCALTQFAAYIQFLSVCLCMYHQQSHPSFEILCDIYLAEQIKAQSDILHAHTVRETQTCVCVCGGWACVHLYVYQYPFVYTHLIACKFLFLFALIMLIIIICSILTRHDWGAECSDSTTNTPAHFHSLAWGLNEAAHGISEQCLVICCCFPGLIYKTIKCCWVGLDHLAWGPDNTGEPRDK